MLTQHEAQLYLAEKLPERIWIHDGKILWQDFEDSTWNEVRETEWQQIASDVWNKQPLNKQFDCALRIVDFYNQNLKWYQKGWLQNIVKALSNPDYITRATAMKESGD